MVFLEILELVFVVLVIILGVTQVIIPLWNNRPLFPAFRMPAKVERELADVEEELESLRTERKVQEKKQEATTLKDSLSPKKGDQ